MAGVPLDIAWLNGKILSPVPAHLEAVVARVLPADQGCYTTALFRMGLPVWRDRHARRLKRDAQALGLGKVDEPRVHAALEELGSAAFAGDSGIVRVTAYLGERGNLNLLGEARDLSGVPDLLRAVTSPDPLDTEGRVWTGAKGSNFAFYVRVREIMSERGCEEVILYDREGFVIEGCVANLFVVDGRGDLIAPNLSRGAVAGLAQEMVHECVPEVVVRDMPLSELADVREIIAVNSVRHAMPIVQLDQKPVGTGQPGEWFRRLYDILSSQD
jgi:branched-subunit amino acid aminotransferase/4-amino-4-deoxychorismate lyase